MREPLGRVGAGQLLRCVVELALEYDVPLLAANLSNADTGKVARTGYGAVFPAEAQALLKTSEALPDPA